MDENVTEPMSLCTLVRGEMLKPSLRIILPDGKHPVILDPNLKREYFIGRGKENDILADDGRVSRRHGRVFYEIGWHYEDLHSLNGSILENDEFIYRQGGIEISPNPEPHFIIISAGVITNLNRRKGTSLILPCVPPLIQQPHAANIKHLYLGSKFEYEGVLSRPEQGYQIVLEIIKS